MVSYSINKAVPFQLFNYRQTEYSKCLRMVGVQGKLRILNRIFYDYFIRIRALNYANLINQFTLAMKELYSARKILFVV